MRKKAVKNDLVLSMDQISLFAIKN